MEIENLKFDENGLIPAIIQDAETRTVLMLPRDCRRAWLRR